MIYTHVLRMGGGAVRSPLDNLLSVGTPTPTGASAVPLPPSRVPPHLAQRHRSPGVR